MLGYLPALILQCIGVAIPIIGIIVLMKKGQGKENIFLVMSNFGALIMNWGYLQLLRSKEYQAAVSVYKFEYIGSVIFYLFFILFLKSFFFKTKKSRLFACVYFIFFAVESAALAGVLLDSPYAYKTVNVMYREDDGKLFTGNMLKPGAENDELEELPPSLPQNAYATDADGSASSTDTETEADTDSVSDTQNSTPASDGNPPAVDPGDSNDPVGPGNASAENAPETPSRGYATISFTHGTMLEIRYCLLAFMLASALVASFVLMCRRKVKEERLKMIYLVIAECVVYISLMISIFGTGTFNPSPFLISCSIMSIICGTASGNFFTIADLGRGWVLDHSGIIFVIIDKQFRFLDASEYAKKIFPELEKLPIHSLLPDELKETFKCENCDLKFGDKQYFKRVDPIESDGKTIGYSILFMDLTEHYQLMEQLEEQTQKAIAANEAKSNFMSNMSHEIRTPMNAIVGMTEIMLRHDQDAFNTEYLNNIKNSGNALLSVINDILDFSKIESGKLEIVPDEYEIMSVLNDLSMIFLNRIGEKPIELIYDIDPAMPVKLYGDSGRIRQVLLNIVNNGIKYTDEGHVKLIIKAEMLPDNEMFLNCAVEDTGIGIKKEDLPKLFSTFSQVDTKRNRGKEGTGLGLSIAKQLVEAMDGSFSVESEYGVGSTFSFSMKQKIVDASFAARIKNDDEIYVTGSMAYDESLEMLKKLCTSYEHVNFVNPEDCISRQVEKLDYVFIDRDFLCAAEPACEEKEAMEKYHPEIIMIHNPMKDNCSVEGVTSMNKPLYTLNFCLAINHEVMNFRMKDEKLMSFTAPDAKILIVDDNEMNRKVAAGLLEPIGMNVDMAVDGKQAVEKVKENRYDIVFMDHMMPIMDGVEAAAAIRSLPDEYYRTLPIIALSANALQEAKEQFKAAGMDDFLAKPIKTKQLFKLVKKYLPKDKVIESGEQLEESKVSEDALPVIEGLNVAAGVENSGGLKLFTSLLGDFYKLIDRKSVKIEKCLADGMLRDYTIEVHALKNTARMIGALELSDMFYELEKAGNAEDMDLILKKTEPTLSLYRSYKPILEPYAVTDNTDKTELSTEEFRSALTQLKDAMDSFDLDSADAAMKKMENSRVPEKFRSCIEDLGALVADVAMEDVMTLCEQLLEEI